MSEDQKCTGPFSDARDCPVHGPRPHPLSLLRVNAGEEIRALNDELTAARAEIAALKHDLSRHLSITSEQATEILGKEALLKKAGEALDDVRSYAQHLAECAIHNARFTRACDCGISASLTKARAVLSELQLKGK